MSQEQGPESIINIQEALVFTAGDRDMLNSMAELFLTEGPAQLQDVRDRVASGDAAGIRKTAHTLKGSVVIFGAKNAAAAAVAMETAAEDGDLSGVPAAFQRLEMEMSQLIGAVKQLCGK